MLKDLEIKAGEVESSVSDIKYQFEEIKQQANKAIDLLDKINAQIVIDNLTDDDVFDDTGELETILEDILSTAENALS